MTAPVVVGVDIGGSKVLAGVVTDDGTVLRTARRTTPGRTAPVSVVEEALTEAVLEVAGDAAVAAVGLAAAGFVDRTGDRVVFAPHLPWRDDPVRARLAQRWGVPVVLDNDANCAALAESEYGAARGASSALVVTMGTGIGGGVVLAGEVLRGAGGMAGEFGHMKVEPGGAVCECGGEGCWEQYSSGNALLRWARAAFGTQPSLLEELCGGNPLRLTGPMITAAAEQGDLLARQALGEVGEWLGVGLANLVAAFDPECLVVGGGLSSAGDALLEPARRALARSLVGVGHRDVPPVHRAALGPEAGLVGAAVRARRGQARR